MSVKDIVLREEYEKDGQTEVTWLQIGKLIDAKNGKQYVKLNFMPGQLLSVFEQKKKGNKQDELAPDTEIPF